MKDFDGSNFTDKLKARMQQERNEIENLTLGELQSLRERLKQLSTDALTTIANDMAEQYRSRVQGPMVENIRLELEKALSEVNEKTKALQSVTTELETDVNRIRTASRSTWAWVLFLRIGILVICFGAAWGGMTWFSKEVQRLREEREGLTKKIAEQEETLAGLNNQLWGVTLKENEKGRFVVLPPGAGFSLTWTVDGRPAVLFWMDPKKTKVETPPPGKRRR